MQFFDSMGCSVSDHALEYVMYKPYTDAEIEAIFAKRLSGEAITTEEMNKFKTAFMVSVGKEYNKRNWVMQLHYGTIRDNNRFRYDQLGPDTGFDCINTYDCSAEMAQFLNALNATDELPKTIIYSLNPNVGSSAHRWRRKCIPCLGRRSRVNRPFLLPSTRMGPCTVS